jgi:hypothetical protein
VKMYRIFRPNVFFILSSRSNKNAAPRDKNGIASDPASTSAIVAEVEFGEGAINSSSSNRIMKNVKYANRR